MIAVAPPADATPVIQAIDVGRRHAGQTGWYHALDRMRLEDYRVRTWREERRTVVHVTHDIEEAVYLADRIVILKPSPGRIAADLDVDLPRPRDRNATEFLAVKSRVLQEMRQHGIIPD